MAENFVERNDEVRRLMGELGNEIPAIMEGFGRLHHAASADGALDVKTKELIALAIAITVRCDGCIAYHVYEAMKAGATRAEMMETIGMSILMGGGPSVVYGSEAYEAITQFEAERVAA